MACGMGSVEVSTWVKVSRHCDISYRVYPRDDTIEFTMGRHEELVMVTNEAGLSHCITEFTNALNDFQAAAPQPDETSDDLLLAGDPSPNHAE